MKLAHEKNSSMTTQTSPVLASLLCFKSAFFNGSLSHLPKAIKDHLPQIRLMILAVAVLAQRLSASSLEVYSLVVTRGHRTEL